jgi:hypothetical protein
MREICPPMSSLPLRPGFSIGSIRRTPNGEQGDQCDHRGQLRR